jgi:hypothetical protein
MIDEEFRMDNPFCWQNAGSSWRNFERIKYLKTLSEAITGELRELEKDQEGNKELINQEKTLLEAVQKEIRRIERKTLFSELGVE